MISHSIISINAITTYLQYPKCLEWGLKRTVLARKEVKTQFLGCSKQVSQNKIFDSISFSLGKVEDRGEKGEAKTKMIKKNITETVATYTIHRQPPDRAQTATTELQIVHNFDQNFSLNTTLGVYHEKTILGLELVLGKNIFELKSLSCQKSLARDNFGKCHIFFICFYCKKSLVKIVKIAPQIFVICSN